MTTRSNSTGHLIAIAAVVIGVPGSLVAWNQLTEELGSDSVPATTNSGGADGSATGGGTDTGGTGTGASDDTGGTDTGGGTDAGAGDATGLSGCVIEVDHIGAEIRSSPTHSALFVASVPSGAYEPTDTTISSWAGADERWYELNVDGKTGWLAVNPIIVKSQSTDCP